MERLYTSSADDLNSWLLRVVVHQEQYQQDLESPRDLCWLFLVYINDIADKPSSAVRLFADDTIIYYNNPISTPDDQTMTQKDLNVLDYRSLANGITLF